MLLGDCLANNFNHNLVELARLPATPVIGVLGKDDFLVGRVRLKHVGPGAGFHTGIPVLWVHGRGCQGLRADYPGSVQGGEDQVKRCGVQQGEFYREVVNRLDLIERVPDERGTGVILGGFDRLLDGIGRKRLAVVELDVRAQVEDPDQTVGTDVPTGGKQRSVHFSRAGWVGAQQLFVHVAHVGRFGREGRDRVPRGKGRRISDVQYFGRGWCRGYRWGRWLGHRRCRGRCGATRAQREHYHQQQGKENGFLIHILLLRILVNRKELARIIIHGKFANSLQIRPPKRL